MCSNYQLYKNADDLETYYNAKWEIHKDRIEIPESLWAKYQAPVASIMWNVDRPRGRVVQFARWGWEAKIKGKPKTVINSRIETVAGNRKFYGPRLDRERCLIPATSFIEFLGETKPKRKTSFSIGGELFSIGGFMMLDRWFSGVPAFTMLTVPADNEMKGLHLGPVNDYRQPFLIPRALEDAWLDPNLNFDDVLPMVKSHSLPGLVGVPV